jgi:hypothetical protein
LFHDGRKAASRQIMSAKKKAVVRLFADLAENKRTTALMDDW